MLVGRCLNTHLTTPASRSQTCSQRCCAYISSTGHQQPQITQAAARTSATSEVCQGGIVPPVAGHLSGLYQLLEPPRTELSVQAQLNDRLKRCCSWEELAALLEANLDIVDFVNISTGWTRLAKLFESTGPHRHDGQATPRAPPVREPAFRRFLAQLIDTTSQKLRLFGVQALANVMWALSNADWQLEQYEPAVGRLMHEWCASVHKRLPDLRAPDVSNISTAIGRLDHWWRPAFVVEFYLSVLHRPDLLEHLDLTTLNNLLYGMSRASRRGLIHMEPAARRLLAQYVDRVIERSDREAAGLVPWRAAQLLYNCHKFKLRVRSNLYSVLMPVVAEVYACEPNPMDRWSIGFLTAFVAAHRRVHPAARPDLRPLYAYVERRLPEASTSQMAMLAHAFRDLGCPPPASFWGQLFSRYMPVTSPMPLTASLTQQQPQAFQQQQQQQLMLAQQRQWQLGRTQGSQQQLAAESVDGWATQMQPQQQHGHYHQHLEPPKAQAWILTPHASQQRQQSPSRLPHSQLQLQVQYHQQQATHPHPQQHQQRTDRVPCSDMATAPEPHQTPHLHRPAALLIAQSHHPPQQACAQGPYPVQPEEPLQQQQQQQQPRRLQPQLPYTEGPDWMLRQREGQPQQQLLQQRHLLPNSSQRVPQPLQPEQEVPGDYVHRPQGSSDRVQQPELWALQLQAPHLRPQLHTHLHPRVQSHPSLHPRPHYPHTSARSAHPGMTSVISGAQTATPSTTKTVLDDHEEPHTLHYVCWQAAKAGILPPRAFLRLYVDRVPQWLVHSANDTQVAQAVETLKLLRWVPRRELREMLCATLKHRAATSRLPMRSLLQWVRKQR